MVTITNLKKETKTSFDISELDNLKLIPKNQYRAILSKQLPEECFKTDTKHVLHYLFFMALYVAGIYSIANITFLPYKLFISIVMGISLAALTFFLHDLFHGSIIKSRKLTYLCGLSIGIFNLFAPLFWQRVHNLHHARTGNTDDPDRSYVFYERPKNLFETIIYKTRVSNESVHPALSLIFMSTGFFWYFLNTMFFGLLAKKLSIHWDKKYKRIQELFKRDNEKIIVLFELAMISTVQVCLFVFAAHKNFLDYFLISLLPVAISHFIAMSYIHTNHFLSPLTGEVDDPLVNSLSLKDPWIVDKVFSNFSHHVEHHLFPAMSSSQYPKVRKLLQKLYPERFQLITMVDAMKRLLSTPRIYHSYTSLIDLSGKKASCLLPGS